MRILIVAGFIMLSACNSAVTNFVGSSGPQPGPTPTTPSPTPVPVGPTGPVKLSPGHIVSTSAEGTLDATVTPSRQTLTSGAGQLRLSISRRRFDTN